jgi:hypothetical protein
LIRLATLVALATLVPVVNASAMSGEHGRNAGAPVNMVTTSGIDSLNESSRLNVTPTRVGKTTANEKLKPAHVDEVTFGVQRKRSLSEWLLGLAAFLLSGVHLSVLGPAHLQSSSPSLTRRRDA